MLTKTHAKDNKPRTMALPEDLAMQLAAHITVRRLGPGELLPQVDSEWGG